MGRVGRISVEDKLAASCLSCGYALRGLPSRRCPECARDVDWDNPWTLRLPGRPNGLLRWLGRSPGRVTRAVPWIALALVAYGTRVPGWASMSLQAGVLAALACAIGWRCAAWARRRIQRRGYPLDDSDFLRTRKRMHILLAVIALIVVLRPLAFAGFWISKPALQRVADEVLRENFATAGGWRGERAGVYYVGGTRRCPHGVKLDLHVWDSHYRNSYRLGASSGAFFYKPESGTCDKFYAGLPLGGGWYMSID